MSAWIFLIYTVKLHYYKLSFILASIAYFLQDLYIVFDRIQGKHKTVYLCHGIVFYCVGGRWFSIFHINAQFYSFRFPLSNTCMHLETLACENFLTCMFIIGTSTFLICYRDLVINFLFFSCLRFSGFSKFQTIYIFLYCCYVNNVL